MALIGAFTYNRKLTYDTTTTRAHISANISNFPLCVAINQYSWSTSTDRDKFFDASNVGGKRIQFYDYDTTTNLPYEVEYYDATIQEAVYWVKVPTILHDGDANYATRNFIYAGYGNDPNSSDQDAATSVWDSNFKGVWHLGGNSWVAGDTSSEAKDSTSNARHGDSNLITVDQDGQIAKCPYFGDPYYISFSPTGLPSGTSQRTLSCWFYSWSGNYDKYLFSYGNNSTNYQRFSLMVRNTTQIWVELRNAQRTVNFTNDNRWHHFCATFPVGQTSSEYIKIYLDGVEQSTAGSVVTINTDASATCYMSRIAGSGTGYVYGSYADEFRISDIDRGADWINLEYWSTKKFQSNGDGWLAWEGEPATQKVSHLLGEVEYTLEGNVIVSALRAEVEYDLANPSLQTSNVLAEVEYDTANPSLQSSNVYGEVEYDDSINATPAIMVGNSYGEVEYDIEPNIVVSSAYGEVEYDTVPNLLVSTVMGEVEYESTDTPSTTQTFTNTITSGTAGAVQTTQTFINGFLTTLSIVNDWYGNVQTLENSILNDTTGITQTITNSLLTYEPVKTSQINSFSILADYDFDVMTPTYQILLDGMDVSQKIMSCNITYNRANFVGECSIIWKDWTLFNQIDCSDYTKNYKIERIEVKTRLLDTDDWTSHGTFFIEKRDTAMTVNEILPTSWGRNKPAILGEPFATTITKTWDYDTTAQAIALEVINGLCTLDWQIMDYPIYTGRFSANKERPIAIINRLAQVLGGIVTTDKQGRVRVIYEWQM